MCGGGGGIKGCLHCSGIVAGVLGECRGARSIHIYIYNKKKCGRETEIYFEVVCFRRVVVYLIIGESLVYWCTKYVPYVVPMTLIRFSLGW